MAATQEEYLAHPNQCPYCESDSIEGHSVEVDAGGAWQAVSCLDCYQEWVDIYKLVRWEAYN